MTATAPEAAEMVTHTGIGGPASTRDPHVDVMKGWVMLLIIVTHMETLELLGYGLVAYILTFALAVFFFLSGYLYRPVKGQGFGRYTAHKARTLLLPYVAFFLISFLWTNTIYAYYQNNALFGYSFTWPEFFSALVFAGKYLFEFPLVPSPIWFLHALFFASLIFYFAMKVKQPLALAGIALVLAGITVPLKRLLADCPIWLFRLLPPALFFMVCGALFRRVVTAKVRERMRQSVVLSLFGPMVCLVAGAFLMQKARGDLWEIDSYLYFPGALISILGCFEFAQSLNSTALRFVGENSLLYLGLHPLVLILPPIYGLPAWIEGRGFDGILLFMGYFIVAFALTSLLVLAVRGVQRLFSALHSARNNG